MLRVAAVQMRGDRAPIDHRLARIEALLREAAAKGAKLAVLPELALTGYELGAWNFEIAEALPGGPACSGLAQLARAHDVIVVAGLSERGEDGEIYNTMACVGPDGYLGRYRKLHPASAECAYWRAGTTAEPIETDLGRIGIGICADMIRRTPWSIYAQSKVDLVAIGAAWPDYTSATNYPLGREYRRLHVAGLRELPERIEREVGAPVVMANACGSSEVDVTRFGPRVTSTFGGRSRVVCGGTIAEDRGDQREQVIVADVQRGATIAARSTPDERWVPHGDATFRATFQSVDVVTGFMYRPMYYVGARRARSTQARRVSE